MFTRSVSIEAMSSRLVISISVAIFRIRSRSVWPDLTYSSMIGVEGTRRASTISMSRGLGFLALRRRLCLRGGRGRAEFLEDLLGLFLGDELRETLGLRGRELLQREAGVREDLRRLLRDPAVPQRLNRCRSGHRHSS